MATTLIKSPQHPDAVTDYIDHKYATGHKYLEDLSTQTGYQLPHHALPHELHSVHKKEPRYEDVSIANLEFTGTGKQFLGQDLFA